MSESAVLTVPVGGMHCQNCVNAVQKKLSALPGVAAVEVNLDKGLAVLRGTGMNVAAVKDAIEELGFDAGDPV